MCSPIYFYRNTYVLLLGIYFLTFVPNNHLITQGIEYTVAAYSQYPQSLGRMDGRGEWAWPKWDKGP